MKKPRHRIKKRHAQKPTDKKEGAQSGPMPQKHRRFLRIAEWTLGPPLALLGAIYTFWGPPWPTEPSFVPGAPSFGSPMDVSFSATNKSGLFSVPNLKVYCEMLCTRSLGRAPHTGVELNHIYFQAHGPDHLAAGETQPFVCAMRGKIAVGNEAADAADRIVSAQAIFHSEYDNPWKLWLTRKNAAGGVISLNTKTVPPQWVEGDLAGTCD